MRTATPMQLPFCQLPWRYTICLPMQILAWPEAQVGPFDPPERDCWPCCRMAEVRSWMCEPVKTAKHKGNCIKLSCASIKALNITHATQFRGSWRVWWRHERLYTQPNDELRTLEQGSSSFMTCCAQCSYKCGLGLNDLARNDSAENLFVSHAVFC